MKTIIPYLLCVVLTILLVLSMQECNQRGQTITDSAKLSEKLLHDSCTYYRSKNGLLVSQQNSINIALSDLQNYNDSLTVELSNMKLKVNKVKYVDRIVSQVQVKDSIIAVHDSITKKNPKVKWVDSTKWYQVKGTSEINKTIITYLNLPNTLYLAQGTDGKTYAMNENPYIKSTNLLAVNVTKPKKWYQRNVFKYSVAVIGTLVLRHEAIVYLK